MSKPVAILSTTVLPLDGTYMVLSEQEGKPWPIGSVQFLGLNPVEVTFEGVPHFIGHPATKEIVESLGRFRPPANCSRAWRSGSVP